MQPTAVTYFSGGGLSAIGIRDAGFELAGACEWNPNPKYGAEDVIADHYAKNVSPDIECKSVVDIDPSRWIGVDLFQCSPPCPNFSVAKVGGTETEDDLALAEACARFIRVVNPKLVIVENVSKYRSSESFKRICAALRDGGYFYGFSLENAADYGVPQSRRRLILRASRDGILPSLPTPIRPLNGWHKAVEDLLPGCPDSSFADWQLKRIEPVLRSFLVGVGGEGGDLAYAESEPAQTISSSHAASKYRAFLHMSDNARVAGDPADTVKVSSDHGARAFLHMTQNTGVGTPTGSGLLWADSPANTVCVASDHGARTFLLDSLNATRDATIRESDECAMTLRSDNSGRRDTLKALLVNGQYDAPNTVLDRGASMREADQCSQSITSQTHRDLRAWIAENGRVVKMTSRCLARFQTLPDWYELPEKQALAGRILGNGVPCLFMQRIAEGLRQVL